MPSYLKLSRIEARSKRVEIAGSGQLLRTTPVTEQIQNAISEIRNCIISGKIVPNKYYRKSLVDDTLLESTGIIHLHPGNPGTKELLYLIQYPESILFLMLGDHSQLRDEPRGSILMGLFASHIAAHERSEAERKEIELLKRKKIAKVGLLQRRKK